MEAELKQPTGRRESRLLQRLAKIGLLIIGRPEAFEEVWEITREFLARHAPEFLAAEVEEQEERQGPERDLAEVRRAEMQAFYTALGITVIVPKPTIASNREYRRQRNKGKELFFRLASSVLSYADFMIAVGQSGHWTVVNEDRHRIRWEDAAEGYWFWAEVTPTCPRLKTTWKTLITALKQLIGLEEYVIVWHMCHKAGETIDIPTFSWTRTGYNVSNAGEPERLGALGVCECDGKVRVFRNNPENLDVPYDDAGGRSAEVVQAAAA